MRCADVRVALRVAHACSLVCLMCLCIDVHCCVVVVHVFLFCGVLMCAWLRLLCILIKVVLFALRTLVHVCCVVMLVYLRVVF